MQKGIFQVVADNAGSRKVLGTAFQIFGNRMLTCAHVIECNEARPLTEGFADGRIRKFKDVGVFQSIEYGFVKDIEWVFHESLDVACGRISSGAAPNEHMEVATRSLKPGERVSCFGFPSAASDILHVYERTISAGYSSRGLALDGALAPGMSGGPAVSGGRVVGIVYEDIVDHNLSFIVPIANILQWIEATFPTIREPNAQQSLATIPIAPSVTSSDIPLEVIRVFARQFPDQETAKPFFLSAMKFRREFNDEGFQDEQIVVPEDYLNWSKPARHLWSDIFYHAIRRSQRTLAALLLAPNAPRSEFLTGDERKSFEEFLNKIKE